MLIGMFTRQQNLERLMRVNDRIAQLERKSRPLFTGELEELAEARLFRDELRQYFADLQRMEG